MQVNLRQYQVLVLIFLKWCGEWDLQNLSKAPDEMAAILNKAYPQEAN